MTLRISAVICTRDRADYLGRALASLAGQSLSSAAREVIVVDNGSRDHTPAVLAEARLLLPDLRVVHEPRAGLAHARNAGLAQARGEYVAYLDDDAVADPQWLAAILAVFERVRPTPGCVGGPVRPIWEGRRPAWLADAMLPYLTILDWSPVATALGPDRFIAGANMAFPRALLTGLGGFRADLGRVGTRLLSNEEIAVEQAIRRRGLTCWYEPRAAVGHHVTRERLRRGFFLRRYWWQGVSDAVLEMGDGALPARRRWRRAAARGLAGATAAGKALRTRQSRFAWACEVVRELGHAGALVTAGRTPGV